MAKKEFLARNKEDLMALKILDRNKNNFTIFSTTGQSSFIKRNSSPETSDSFEHIKGHMKSLTD
jgi:hypothetical protein